MHNIITIAIIIFVILFATVLAKGTSFSAFLSDVAAFVKRVFHRKPVVLQNDPENKRSPGTTGLSGRVQNDTKGLSLVGRSAKSGIQAKITVDDKGGSVIGTKTVYIDDNPLLIGRGTDSNGYGAKLCLPDISEEPTTSRCHCTLENDNGDLLLRDCYDQSVAFDPSGSQIHSVSIDYRTNEYVGDGLVIACGDHADVEIGDYVLKIKNLSHFSLRSVPTYGSEKRSPAPTKGVVRSAPPHVPTREFKYKYWKEVHKV